MLGAVCIFFTLTNYAFHGSLLYSYLLGTLSSGIEALLGVPQFYLNFARKNTTGLSTTLILMWCFGDFYKLNYYVFSSSPFPLIACSVFQVCTDSAILFQIWYYKRYGKPAAVSRVAN